MATSDDREITFTLIDIADFVYESSKVLAISFLIGIAFAILAVFLENWSSPFNDVDVTVYSGGTPSHSGLELAELMASTLTKANVGSVYRSATVVTIRPNDQNAEERISSVLTEFELYSDQQIYKTFRYLDLLDPEAKDADVVRRYRSYLAGRESGLIPVYEVANQGSRYSARDIFYFTMIPVIGVFCGLLFAGFKKFVQVWRKQRSSTL